MRDKLRHSGKFESGVHHVGDVGGSVDEDVEHIVFEVGLSPVNGGYAALASLNGVAAEVYTCIFVADVDDVDGVWHDVLDAAGIVDHHVGEVDLLAVKRRNLWRTIYYKSAVVVYCGVRQRLEYHFISYTVDITVGDANHIFVVRFFFHYNRCYNLNHSIGLTHMTGIFASLAIICCSAAPST